MTVDQLVLFSLIRKEASSMMYEVIYYELKKGERKLYTKNKEEILDKLGSIYEYSMDGRTQERVSYINFHSLFEASDSIASAIECVDPIRIDRIILSSNFPSVELEDEDIKLLRLIYIEHDGMNIPSKEKLKKEIAEKLKISNLEESLTRLSRLGIMGFYQD